MARYRARVALVTGGASGIGRAICEAMAAEGATVIVADLQAAQAEQAAAAIRAAGGSASAAALDVTDAVAVERLVEETVERHGRLDYLFNNAGIAIAGEARHRSLSEWNRTIDVNLRGVVHGVHAGYRVMIRQGFGHIVNTASLAGLMPAVNEIDYVASKHAVVGLSTTLRAEAADYGVKVSVVCPGFVDTAILGENLQHVEDAPGVRLSGKAAIERFFKIRVMPVGEAAEEILRGVDRNLALIVVTPHAKVFYWLQRLVPGLVLSTQQSAIRKFRRIQARI